MGDEAEAARTGADLFVEALQAYGATRVFGNPGTTELPVVKAIQDGGLDYVLCLHEDVAVGMAAGYAQARRYHAHAAPDAGVTPLGVANLHVAPGLAHGLANLYNAHVAGAPILVTAGDHSLSFRHEDPILSGPMVEMARPFTKWSAEVDHVDALPTMVRRAVRTALAPPTGPVFLALPMDVMMAPADADPEPLGPIPSAGPGDTAQIGAAAELLADGDEAPVLVLGDGVARSGALDAAVKLAEACGARVHHEMLACEANFPTDHDQWTSDIPPYEGMGSMLLNAPTLIFIGCSTNTTLIAHEGRLVPEDATCIHVSDDAWQLGKNEPSNASILGDPALVLDALADAVDARIDEATLDARLEQVQSVKSFVHAQIAERGEGEETDSPLPSKADLVDAMKAVAADALIVDEGVTAEYALRTRWTFTQGSFIANKGWGLGWGTSAAVGACFAERERPDAAGPPRRVLGFVADGSYLYYPQAIWTAVAHDLPLTVVVPDNQSYRILKENLAEIYGGEAADYDEVPGMNLQPPADIAKSAEAFGAKGVTVDKAEEIQDALKRALDAGGPVVVDVRVHD